MRMESFHVYSESIKKTERCSVGIRGETKYCIPLYERARVLLDVLFSPPTFRIAPILVIRTGRKRNKKIWSEKSRLANDSGGGSEEQKKKQTRRVVKKSRAGDEAIQPLRRNSQKKAQWKQNGCCAPCRHLSKLHWLHAPVIPGQMTERGYGPSNGSK